MINRAMTNKELIDGKIGRLRVLYSLQDHAVANKFYKIADDILKGKPIILVDDMERENEGDLMIAASFATINNIAFMARWGRGIMCLPSDGSILDRLQIPMMVPPQASTDPFNTPFTVSVDAKEGVSTGVSAADRVETIKLFLNSSSKPTDLVRPGHLFPLRTRDGLLTERRGHTEASVTLTKILGLCPVAVIVEIMNDDGTMARLPELICLAEQHDLKIFSIAELVKELNV